jgi:hypothetical protein
MTTRTTISLADDVAAGVEELRREQRLSLSEAVNELARAGLKQRPVAAKPFRQRSLPIGLGLDVTSVAEALELLDGPDQR